MWAGKKAAGKKNKFEMEKGLVFNKSFDLVLSLKNFNFCNLAGSIAYNGKSICEGRAKLDEKFNFDRTKQIAFSDYQITKKSNMKSKLRLNASGISIKDLTPPFANTMLN